jgi:hypothetical protein
MHTDLDHQRSACGERLRRLPDDMLPPYNWQEFQRRTRRRLPVVPDRLDWRHAVAAAVLVVIVGAIAAWSRVGMIGYEATDFASSGNAAGRSAAGQATRDAPGSSLAANSPQAAERGTDFSTHDAEAASVGGDTAADQTQVESAAARAAFALQARAARAQAIESWLASLPQEPIVMRVGTRADVAGLEDRIAQVDDLLTSARVEKTQPDRLEALQQERVRLVGSLAQVRYAEVVAATYP